MQENNVVQKRMKIEDRRNAILQVAEKLFFQNGYSGTSLNAILAESGGSKRNFYTEFEGKEGLFKALILENISLYVKELETIRLPSESLRTALQEAAGIVVRSFTEPVPVGLYRIFMMDGARFPEVGKIFLENGSGRIIDIVAELLKSAGERGEIPVQNYKNSADIFCSMLRGSMFQELMLGLRPAPGKKEEKEFIDSVVEVFLNGITGLGHTKGK